MLTRISRLTYVYCCAGSFLFGRHEYVVCRLVFSGVGVRVSPVLVVLRMCIAVQVRFFLAFLRAGFDILCADLDVLWLRDPRPWVTGQVR